MKINKKLLLVSTLCAGILVITQSFTLKDHDDKATNLKVLPKNTSEEDLHNIMRGYSKALGVRCNYCHVSQEVPGQQHPKFDFAADDKPEKNVARDMMRMVDAINAKYIDKIQTNGHAWEQITCVTCHNGKATPIVSTDSLMKKQ